MTECHQTTQDVTSGGRGNDQLEGGQDSDVYYGGQGQDTVSDVGSNQTYVQQDDVIKGKGNQITQVNLNSQPGSSIRVPGPPGTPELQAQINADLEKLRSAPPNRQLLEALDRTGKTIRLSRKLKIMDVQKLLETIASQQLQTQTSLSTTVATMEWGGIKAIILVAFYDVFIKYQSIKFLIKKCNCQETKFCSALICAVITGMTLNPNTVIRILNYAIFISSVAHNTPTCLGWSSCRVTYLYTLNYR